MNVFLITQGRDFWMRQSQGGPDQQEKFHKGLNGQDRLLRQLVFVEGLLQIPLLPLGHPENPKAITLCIFVPDKNTRM